MTPRIVSLAERPDLATTVAYWQWLEWGRPHGRRLGSVRADVAALTVPDGPEAGFVLLDGVDPVGTASLTLHDLDARPDLSPWLASVFVTPHARGRGHATRLVRAVEAAASARGVARLWLFTATAAGLYARLGWQAVGQEQQAGEAVTLMCRTLRVAPPPAAAGR